MLLADLRIGDKVMIVAKDDFYAYVDGWRGFVDRFDAGVVVCRGPGMQAPGLQGSAGEVPRITLWVPADQLIHTI